MNSSLKITHAYQPNPMKFCGVSIPSPMSNSLETMNIVEPTPIQKAAIGPLTTGLSAILHAETGSGKTLTYLLPLLKRLYFRYVFYY